MEALIVDELTKILPTQRPQPAQLSRTRFANEPFQFQIAWKETPQGITRIETTITICAGDSAIVQCEEAMLVGATTPFITGDEDGYLVSEPALVPDVLRPLRVQKSDNETKPVTWTCQANQRHQGWNSVWVSIENPGNHIDVSVGGIPLPSITITTIPALLPQPDIVNTRWFHCDSLAHVARVPVWSEAHWKMIENHMIAARRMHINCLLMPLWTPPLDTAPGQQRLPTQLLEITRDDNGQYSFDGTRAIRWLNLLKKHGFSAVEIPHIFTQWGAKACAQFYIRQDDDVRPAFGWDTPATDPAYREFLEQLIAFVRQFLGKHVDPDSVYFHISDEPDADNVATYLAAQNQVRDLLDGCRVIDALSEVTYHELVETPVVATDAIATFRAHNIEPEWVYYCICQETNLANQFIAQRPNRHRQLGFQLYKARARGFLQWGYNFYNTQLSTGYVDPFWENDAGGGFISGDPFIVYPAPEGKVWESIRHRMVGGGFADLATCQFAEKLIGRDGVLKIIDPDGDLDYDTGWVSERELIRRREELNSAINASLNQETKEV
ncbi:DUF4091 domain-containing protein [Arcanobacterium pinnipediorum]|uniref:DUF4091 domain-containing protein n=1 Tax=Arcanobacterium pinnipediorum TaxID=1503041 RepID=A0ABY5AI22_9ACTO|nr:DUF4091 domain-containing protein [Arcanobacterium pinnipediorum]USR79573.1 DUF4091 domain-containing protein [Arcanobacterium pinnipediorum]